MTAMIVIVALIAANIAYSIYDARLCDAEAQMEDFIRVEYKKDYNVEQETKHLLNTVF